LPIAIERPDGRLDDTLLETGHQVVPVKPNAIKASREAKVLSDAEFDPDDAEVTRPQGNGWLRRLTPKFDGYASGFPARLKVIGWAAGVYPVERCPVAMPNLPAQSATRDYRRSTDPAMNAATCSTKPSSSPRCWRAFRVTTSG